MLSKAKKKSHNPHRLSGFFLPGLALFANLQVAGENRDQTSFISEFNGL